tara:strand:+ start:1521 stop:2723 length:1203 start_codon:yes stop_codon:yes gene_type:complete
MFERLIGLIGIFVLLATAFLLSNNRSKINYRTVGWGFGLQFIFAFLILKTSIGKPLFGFFDKTITKLISFSNDGANFLFGDNPIFESFAFRVLPSIIFFSALMSVLYHFGITQRAVSFIAKIMQRSMGTSGPETLSVSANIFVGQTESPLLIKPYILKMTRSELMTLMVGGFATVAGGVLAFYVTWLSSIPGIAGHLLSASVMSAPAALAIAKIIYPEVEVENIDNNIKLSNSKQYSNIIEALGGGTSDGLKLAVNVGAMLIAFISIIAMTNYSLSFLGTSLEIILGYLFQPLAWSMGISWEDSAAIGSLLGKKIVFTELIAFGDLKEMIDGNVISNRSAIIASYALCGFANFGSIGIQLGGIGGIAPDRKKDISELVFKAMIGGALASFITASIAGILI